MRSISRPPRLPVEDCGTWHLRLPELRRSGAATTPGNARGLKADEVAHVQDRLNRQAVAWPLQALSVTPALGGHCTVAAASGPTGVGCVTPGIASTSGRGCPGALRAGQSHAARGPVEADLVTGRLPVPTGKPQSNRPSCDSSRTTGKFVADASSAHSKALPVVHSTTSFTVSTIQSGTQHTRW